MGESDSTAAQCDKRLAIEYDCIMEDLLIPAVSRLARMAQSGSLPMQLREQVRLCVSASLDPAGRAIVCGRRVVTARVCGAPPPTVTAMEPSELSQWASPKLLAAADVLRLVAAHHGERGEALLRPAIGGIDAARRRLQRTATAADADVVPTPAPTQTAPAPLRRKTDARRAPAKALTTSCPYCGWQADKEGASGKLRTLSHVLTRHPKQYADGVSATAAGRTAYSPSQPLEPDETELADSVRE